MPEGLRVLAHTPKEVKIPFGRKAELDFGISQKVEVVRGLKYSRMKKTAKKIDFIVVKIIKKDKIFFGSIYSVISDTKSKRFFVWLLWKTSRATGKELSYWDESVDFNNSSMRFQCLG